MRAFFWGVAFRGAPPELTRNFFRNSETARTYSESLFETRSFTTGTRNRDQIEVQQVRRRYDTNNDRLNDRLV